MYNSASKAKVYAERICAAIAGLGFKNRGMKYNTGLYALRKTSAPAMLIECCFVDDKDDVQMYDYQEMADAIIYGITSRRVEPAKDSDADRDAAAPGSETPTGDKKKLYRVQVGAYSVAGNAATTQAKLTAAGFDVIIVKA